MKRLPPLKVEATSRMPAARFSRSSEGPAPAPVNVTLNVNEPAPPFPTRPWAAFTLIELMVATAITSLLLLGMTGIFDQSMKAWRLSSRRADAEREIRAVLTMVQRDFAGVVVQTNLPIICLTNSSFGNLIGPFRTPAYGQGTAVFFLTTSAAGASSANPDGDLAGVGYYIAWTTTTNASGTNGAYHLYRYYLTGTNLLNSISNYLSTGTSFFRTNPLGDELVGANVVHFLAEFKSLPAGFGNVTNHETPLLTNRPGYVQLELTAYGSEAARALSVSNDWTSSNNIQKFGRTHLWRVDL